MDLPAAYFLTINMSVNEKDCSNHRSRTKQKAEQLVLCKIDIQRLINLERIAYHRHEVANVINTKCCISSLRKSIQPTADDMHLR